MQVKPNTPVTLLVMKQAIPEINKSNGLIFLDITIKRSMQQINIQKKLGSANSPEGLVFGILDGPKINALSFHLQGRLKK